MLRSIGPAGCIAVFVVIVASTGCADSPAADSAGGTPVAPEEAAGAAARLRAAAPPDVDAPIAGGVPLQAVTGLAVTPRGLIVGGVSPAEDLFWDAWFVPADGGPAQRLAPVDNLAGVDAGGAIWTTVVSEDESGEAAYEVRLSPADGSPARPLAPGLPPTFCADRVVPDGEGGRLLIGTERREDGVRAASVFAVGVAGAARRVARDPGPDSALVVGAALGPGALILDLLYAADRPSTIIKVAWPQERFNQPRASRALPLP